jgi:hypothetical protein
VRSSGGLAGKPLPCRLPGYAESESDLVPGSAVCSRDAHGLSEARIVRSGDVGGSGDIAEIIDALCFHDRGVKRVGELLKTLGGLLDFGVCVSCHWRLGSEEAVELRSQRLSVDGDRVVPIKVEAKDRTAPLSTSQASRTHWIPGCQSSCGDLFDAAASCYHGAMPKNLTVRLDDELAGDTEALARANGTSMNEAVKMALREAVEHRRADPEFKARLRKIIEEDRELLERLAK